MESQIESVKALDAYRLRQVKHIPELNSDGMILEHKKTGANIFLMSNEDNNKVFCIGFRTPPSDSTGVPHIIEHTVLCGSDKFPVKDPFVELVKGSLNTFLNAMTYPDKTVYPIASCNDTDFQNLMDVYMDAVFHPNIGKEKKIFMQEGWHYELEEPEGEITYNGVVYNEMKGVFSSPESVLDSYIHTAMFPDTCYGVESGGDPEDIVKLTYEDYLAFYHKYYHPSNSYIYLYGDMDMTEKLRWLDEEYLGKYDRKEIDSEIQIQKKFKEPIEREIFYSVSESESLDHATYLSINTQAGNELSPKEYVAFQILEYVLLDAPGASLKKALLDAGIGDDIMGGYEYGILQPYFSVIAKNAEREQKDEFVKIVKAELKKLADGGIDKKCLKAGINNYEFQYREADYGSTPKGLMYGLQCLDSWLYGGDPMMHLEYEDTFAALKKGADSGYFEGLIRTYLLDNPYEAVVIASPKKNLAARIEEQTAKKLKEYKDSLSKEEIEGIKGIPGYPVTEGGSREDPDAHERGDRKGTGEADLRGDEAGRHHSGPPQHVHVRDRLSEGPLQHGPDSDGGPAVSRTLKICPWICGYEKLQLQRFKQRDLFKQRWNFLLRDILPGSHKGRKLHRCLCLQRESALREA